MRRSGRGSGVAILADEEDPDPPDPLPPPEPPPDPPPPEPPDAPDPLLSATADPETVVGLLSVRSACAGVPERSMAVRRNRTFVPGGREEGIFTDSFPS